MILKDFYLDIKCFYKKRIKLFKNSCKDKKNMLICICLKYGGVAKWQTQQTQNLPIAISCRFDPDHRHHKNPLKIDVFKGLFVFLLKIFFLTESVRKPNFCPNLKLFKDKKRH